MAINTYGFVKTVNTMYTDTYKYDTCPITRNRLKFRLFCISENDWNIICALRAVSHVLGDRLNVTDNPVS